MKDLDKTQVYDLRGITEEQAKELYRWLCQRDEVWGDISYRWLREDVSLESHYSEWKLSGSKPTTHISTLFYQPYEQQLREAKKKLEHYKKEVDRLENESKPKVGDVCKFWFNNEDEFVISVLVDLRHEYTHGFESPTSFFKNAKKVTEQEVIDLLFKKSR